MMKFDEIDDSCHVCNKNKAAIVGEAFTVSFNDGCPSEIKADIVVKELPSVRIWGQVKDCQGRPVTRVLLSLLRCDWGRLSSVAHTISDDEGFYQFDLDDESPQGAYKILVSRPVCSADQACNPPYASCKGCEPCQKDNPQAFLGDSLNCCLMPTNGHCKKNALCKTCAYYDEETQACCLENML